MNNLYSSNNRFAGLLSNATEHAEFFILGLACSIVNDPRTASFIDDGHHLQTWEGDSSATVDRFDCRLLLDSLGQLRPRAAGNKSNSIVDEEERLADELWTERFCDLEELAMQKEAEEKRAESANQDAVHLNVLREASDVEEGQGVEASNAIPYQYPTSVEEGTTPTDPPTSDPPPAPPPAPTPATDAPLFRPPYLLLPDYLKPENLPLNQRQHKIITETAKFVRTNGGQVEVLLKVKQASNPNFGFLTHDHTLHPYYRWIVEMDPKEMTIDSAPELSSSIAPSSSLPPLPEAALPPPPPLASTSQPQPSSQTLPWRQAPAHLLSSADPPSTMKEQSTEIPQTAGPLTAPPPPPPYHHQMAPSVGKKDEAKERSEKNDRWSFEDMLRERSKDGRGERQGRRKERKSMRSRSRSRKRESMSRSRSSSRSRQKRRKRSRSRRRKSRRHDSLSREPRSSCRSPSRDRYREKSSHRHRHRSRSRSERRQSHKID